MIEAGELPDSDTHILSSLSYRLVLMFILLAGC